MSDDQSSFSEIKINGLDNQDRESVIGSPSPPLKSEDVQSNLVFPFTDHDDDLGFDPYSGDF